MAVGILVERYQIAPQEGLDLIVAVSKQNHRRVCDVACDLTVGGEPKHGGLRLCGADGVGFATRVETRAGRPAAPPSRSGPQQDSNLRSRLRSSRAGSAARQALDDVARDVCLALG